MNAETHQTTTRKMWRVRVLGTTWVSYAGFYFCRKNFSIAKTSLMDSMEIGASDIAHVFTAYLVAYMLGQFLVGFLGHRTATRTLLLAGMVITLVCNLVFGTAYLMGPAGYWPMLVFMVVNGFAQATGWPGNVDILGNWLKRDDRGKVMAIWATSYQLGSILAKMFAALMLGWFGATWSFWGAAIVMFGVWIAFYLYERDKPEDVGLDPLVEEVEVEVPAGETEAPPVDGFGWTRQVWMSVIFMGCTYFVFKFLRYALDSWSPMAIETLFGLDPQDAGFVSTMFDWVGFGGVLFAGWASDRFFKGRRHQIIVAMTIGMLFAFLFLATGAQSSVWAFAIGLSLCGFLLMGPDSLLAGVGAIDVGGRNGALLAAGMINGLGSIGPIFQEEIIGYVYDRHGFGATFQMMVGMCVLGIIGTAYLSYRSRQGLSTL